MEAAKMDQPTSQGARVGKTKVKQTGQTESRYGSETGAMAPRSNTPTDLRP